MMNHDELSTAGHIRSAKTQNPPAAGVRFIFSSRINVRNNIVGGLGTRIAKGNKGICFDMARSKEGNKMLVVTELTEIASWPRWIPTIHTAAICRAQLGLQFLMFLLILVGHSCHIVVDRSRMLNGHKRVK